MSKGIILISKVNLMGYTAETQMWVVKNGGGGNGAAARTFDFLKAHRAYFEKILLMGQTYNAMRAGRIERFKAYAARQGFEVQTR